jgi:hypothetical protein
VKHNAAFYTDVIDDNGLEIGNDGSSTDHWTGGDYRGELVIHLTLANRPIPKCYVKADHHPTEPNDEVRE